jgi:class 3 adenylate cyclase
MAAEVKKEIQLEIAHVLFTDIVGYSKLPINQQRAVVERLNEIVRGTDEFQAAETAGRLIKIPTGDGITLVFYHSPEDPVECALEISRALKQHPELQLRMGIHSGPVSGIVDATGKANVAGAGINIAHATPRLSTHSLVMAETTLPHEVCPGPSEQEPAGLDRECLREIRAL